MAGQAGFRISSCLKFDAALGKAVGFRKEITQVAKLPEVSLEGLGLHFYVDSSWS